jgi:uncharacterized protein (UPF0264 family)
LTKLLVSIRNEVEASIAADFPIGILDVKEPDRGALGAADRSTLRRIISRLDRGRTISLALGELRNRLPALDGYTVKNLPAGEDVWADAELLAEFRFAKIGLAGMRNVPGWQNRWIDFTRALPNAVQPVAVAYLDQEYCDCPVPEEVLELVTGHPGGVFLLDTFTKRSGDAISLMGVSGLKKLLDRALRHEVMTVVAGSVKAKHLKLLFSMNPDFVGVRGAVCSDGRRQLDRLKLAGFCREFAAISQSRFGEIREGGS